MHDQGPLTSDSAACASLGCVAAGTAVGGSGSGASGGSWRQQWHTRPARALACLPSTQPIVSDAAQPMLATCSRTDLLRWKRRRC